MRATPFVWKDPATMPLRTEEERRKYDMFNHPEVPVKRDGDQLMLRDCPHCRKTHYHGAGGKKGPDYGHRVAHCVAQDAGSKGYTMIDEACW